MKSYTLQERADFYAQAFPKWPAPRVDSRWIDSVWMLGRNYKGSGYYGAYPPNYLRRITSMFPDAERTIHLFSGSLPPGPYVRVDLIKPKNEPRQQEAKVSFVQADVENLFPGWTGAFDFVLADPPYTPADAARYDTPMPNKKKCLHEAARICEPGGYIIWLDTILPMFSKKELMLEGLFCIVRSTNHRVRLASVFRRV